MSSQDNDYDTYEQILQHERAIGLLRTITQSRRELRAVNQSIANPQRKLRNNDKAAVKAEVPSHTHVESQLPSEHEPDLPSLDGKSDEEYYSQDNDLLSAEELRITDDPSLEFDVHPQEPVLESKFRSQSKDICLDNETFADVLSTINGDETEQQEWPEMYKPTISQEIASYVHYELEDFDGDITITDDDGNQENENTDVHNQHEMVTPKDNQIANDDQTVNADKNGGHNKMDVDNVQDEQTEVKPNGTDTDMNISDDTDGEIQPRHDMKAADNQLEVPDDLPPLEGDDNDPGPPSDCEEGPELQAKPTDPSEAQKVHQVVDHITSTTRLGNMIKALEVHMVDKNKLPNESKPNQMMLQALGNGIITLKKHYEAAKDHEEQIEELEVSRNACDKEINEAYDVLEKANESTQEYEECTRKLFEAFNEKFVHLQEQYQKKIYNLQQQLRIRRRQVEEAYGTTERISKMIMDGTRDKQCHEYIEKREMKKQGEQALSHGLLKSTSYRLKDNYVIANDGKGYIQMRKPIPKKEASETEEITQKSPLEMTTPQMDKFSEKMQFGDVVTQQRIADYNAKLKEKRDKRLNNEKHKEDKDKQEAATAAQPEQHNTDADNDSSKKEQESNEEKQTKHKKKKKKHKEKSSQDESHDEHDEEKNKKHKKKKKKDKKDKLPEMSQDESHDEHDEEKNKKHKKKKKTDKKDKLPEISQDESHDEQEHNEDVHEKHKEKENNDKSKENLKDRLQDEQQQDENTNHEKKEKKKSKDNSEDTDIDEEYELITETPEDDDTDHTKVKIKKRKLYDNPQHDPSTQHNEEKPSQKRKKKTQEEEHSDEKVDMRKRENRKAKTPTRQTLVADQSEPPDVMIKFQHMIEDYQLDSQSKEYENKNDDDNYTGKVSYACDDPKCIDKGNYQQKFNWYDFRLHVLHEHKSTGITVLCTRCGKYFKRKNSFNRHNYRGACKLANDEQRSLFIAEFLQAEPQYNFKEFDKNFMEWIEQHKDYYAQMQFLRTFQNMEGNEFTENEDEACSSKTASYTDIHDVKETETEQHQEEIEVISETEQNQEEMEVIPQTEGMTNQEEETNAGDLILRTAMKQIEDIYVSDTDDGVTITKINPPETPKSITFKGVFDEINLIYKVYCNDPRAEIVCKPKRVLKYHLFESLITDGWLDDTVIDFAMETITKHRPGVAAVNTFFFTSLQKYGYKKIRPTVRAEDLINKDVIFIPMNINEQHWVLGVIDNSKKSILVFDSKQCCTTINCKEELRKFYEEALRDHGKDITQLRQFTIEDVTTFSDIDENNDTVVKTLPVQSKKNNKDCGVFCIMYAKYYVKNDKYNFNEKNMQRFRHTTAYEILHDRLLDFY